MSGLFAAQAWMCVSNVRLVNGRFQALIQMGGGELADGHGRIGLGGCEDFVLAEMGEERAFLTKGRHLRESVQAEVAPLELAFAEVAPLGEDDGLAVVGAHGEGVAMDEILREDVVGGAVDVIRFVDAEVIGEGLKHVCAALGDVVREQLDSVGAHNRQQGVVAALKVGFAVSGLDGGQFAAQDGDEEVSASAGGLKETGVDALGLALDEVEHVFDEPVRGEDLSVVCDAPFGLDEAHGVRNSFRTGNSIVAQPPRYSPGKLERRRGWGKVGRPVTADSLWE